ncbi:MAG: short chain dehydrogenase [Oceanospirillales bacterium LUC14_002_19_P2]|nr:MAG: short chain dehydrogenase [Oceanospirillales bacterium LUC14_002_19_P2]
MKILIIGASGTIGKAVTERLKADHQVITANHNSGDYQVDLGNKTSITALFEQVGPVDAVISTTGMAQFGTLEQLSDADYQLGLDNKLMGQVNLVRIGKAYLNKGGSVTLTSGFLAQNPMPGSISLSMVNGALEGFVRAAALELGEPLRVNTVSPVFVTETAQAMGMGTEGTLSAAQTANAYQASIEGKMTGQILDVRDYV